MVRRPEPMRLTVDVWSDVTCPWCYIGEKQLATAVERFEHRDAVQLRMHTYELHPEASTTPIRILDYAESNYGMTPAQARASQEAIGVRAEAAGLAFVVDRLAANSFDLLRLVHLGNQHGMGWEYMRAMQTEAFNGNGDAFEPVTLIRLGEALGVPGDEIRDVLATDRYVDEIQTDRARMMAMGATGVPFTLLDNRLGLSGAAGVEKYGEALRRAWNDKHVA